MYSADTFNDRNQESIDSETLSDDDEDQATFCSTMDDDEHPMAAENLPCNKIMAEEIVTLVTDRSRHGEVMVPYKHNTATLELFDILKQYKIPFENEIYKPQEERCFVDANIYYCKNLFLKDRKGQYFLVICHEDLNMDLKQLRKTLNAYRNFNFATAEEMRSMLSTLPGGATPFGLMNPKSADVKMVIHKSLVTEDAWLMFHPFDNDIATKITLPSLLRFLKSFNHTVTFIK